MASTLYLWRKKGLCKKTTETLQFPLEKIKLVKLCPTLPIHVHPGPQKVTLFRNDIFADETSVRIEMRPYWIRVGPKSQESLLIRDRKGHRHRGKAMWKQREKLECCVYKPRNANDCWQLQKLGERYGRISPLEPPKKDSTCWQRNFWPPGLWENKFLLS